MVLYYAPKSAEEQMQGNPEDMKSVMDAWMAWAKKCGEGMVDLGKPLGNTVRVSKDGETNGNKNIVGYSFLQAGSLDEAKKMLDGHPHLSLPGGEIEVHECLEIPGM